MDLVALFVTLGVILVGAEFFTNGVEWVGHRLDLAEGAVGSVLAAVGTALPETMIPLIAIVVAGTVASDEIGVGAILGAPFMLATLAMFVTGVATLVFRGRRTAGTVARVDTALLGRDARAFLVAYPIAIAAAFLPAGTAPLKAAVAGGLIVLYLLYVRGHLLEDRAADLEDPEPLRLDSLDRRAGRDPDGPPHLGLVLLQVGGGLGLIVAGATVFVHAVEGVAAGLGVAPAILALIIAPIATELPEKFNSVIWVRQGKDNLALGNVTGAMAFQSAFPPSVALLFAPDAWSVGADSGLAFASAAIAVVSLLAIVVPAVRRGRLTASGLVIGGAFYGLYLVLVVVSSLT